MSEISPTQLRFNGSIWCNLDISLRVLDQMMVKYIQPQGLTIIEWYILRALYAQDGQHASELARAVGRAATSFTPNLDKLQNKALIERRPDVHDRRAVYIHLTPQGEELRSAVLNSAERLDTYLNSLVSCDDLRAFLNVLALLQDLDSEKLPSPDELLHKNGHKR